MTGKTVKLITFLLLVIIGAGCSKDPISATQDLATPMLQSPVNQATNIVLSPLLQWQKVENASSYSMQLCLDPAFNKLLVYKQAISGTSYQMPEGLLTGSTGYYWRIRANNANMVSSWSAIWSFITNSSPLVPENPYPADSAINVNNSLTLTWTCSNIDSNDVTHYDVYLSDTYPPTVLIGGNLSTSQCLVDNLKRGMLYYWKVVAKDDYGNLVSGPIWAFETSSPWTKLNSMMVKLYFPGCVFFNGLLYSLGGISEYGSISDVVQIYEPNCNSWGLAPSIPRYITHHMACAVVCNDKIYLIGGISSKSVDEFDPISGYWTEKADMITEQQIFAAVAINGLIYAMGIDSTRNGTVEVYDPITDIWSVKAPMNTSREDYTASVVNGKIYVIGGRIGVYSVNTVEEYDPSTNTWTIKTPMPTRRHWLSSATADGLIYVLGGWYYEEVTRLSCVCAVVECYDPITDTWVCKTPMPKGKMLFGAASDGNVIYTLGGQDFIDEYCDEVYKYDPYLDQ